MLARRLLNIASAGLLSLGLAACGGDGAVPPSGEGGAGPQLADPGLQHIHGLGVGGDGLYIATHSGLWLAPEGETKAQRLGASRQDIMGFSAVEGGRFIGSGHPDPSETDLPPNLGLIESRDGGRSWKSISLLGEADFHVLESAGSRVYGFDGTQGRLMASSDGGRSWEQRKPPAGMFGLAIDPRAPESIVAATERGVFSSADAGESWRSVRDDVTGLVAWPAVDRLYLVDGSGQVQVSADAGRRWQPVGRIGGEPAAFIADEQDLYAALAGGTVKRSTDGGRTWTLRAQP